MSTTSGARHTYTTNDVRDAYNRLLVALDQEGGISGTPLDDDVRLVMDDQRRKHNRLEAIRAEGLWEAGLGTLLAWERKGQG